MKYNNDAMKIKTLQTTSYRISNCSQGTKKLRTESKIPKIKNLLK